MTSITIGNFVKKIEKDAFDNCTGLKRVNISSIESWCNIIFWLGRTNPLYYAQELYLKGKLVTDLVIPDNVKEIGSHSFENYANLKSVKIGDGVTKIRNGAFENCTGLTSVMIPDSVTEIGFSAFENCTGLTSVTIPNRVTEIGRSAFENCTGLTSVTIPDSVTLSDFSDLFSYQKPYCAFKDCNRLKRVSISQTLLDTFIMNELCAFENTPFFEEYAKDRNLCTRCGGEFKGLLIKKCSKCGKNKDY